MSIKLELILAYIMMFTNLNSGIPLKFKLILYDSLSALVSGLNFFFTVPKNFRTEMEFGYNLKRFVSPI